MQFDTCNGMIFQGNHTLSGHYIAYYSWDAHPFNEGQIKELWVFAPDGKRICYLDNVDYKEWFSVYHDFDAVVGAQISQVWHGDNKLLVSAECNDGSIISVDIDVAAWHKWDGDNFEGKTETGKKYCNTPDQLGICGAVKVSLNGEDLGENIVPEELVYLGDDPVPNQAIINKCTHQLEP